MQFAIMGLKLEIVATAATIAQRDSKSEWPRQGQKPFECGVVV
jgi:hypothetical protein